MDNTVKIAFGYKMGCGKDTCVTHLKRKYGGRSLAFADPIYDILHFAQDLCKFDRTKDRAFLQWIGTEWAQKRDPEVWVKLFLERAEELSKSQGFIYCSDLRFKHEFKALKANGWLCVKIRRSGVVKSRIGTGKADHVSETELDELPDSAWDAVIENNGSVYDLHVKMDEFF